MSDSVSNRVRAGLPTKGRGAVSNRTGRFERFTSEAIDDGWRDLNGLVPDEDEPPKLRTTVMRDTSRTVITRNNSPDVGFDRSINPYRGCEHGCIYCYARPSHAYLGHSPGLDFETKLYGKFDAVERLKAEFAAPGYTPEPIMISGITDCYQPVERQLRITRSIIEVLVEHRHPFTLITKNALIARDADLLGAAAKLNLVSAALSVTTLDPALARVMEPRASTPKKRLAAIKALSEAGVPMRVMVAPIIPGLTDPEIESILEAVRDAGATGAGFVMLRMPHEIKELFAEWLTEHFADRAQHVLSLMRQVRGGKLYDSQWFSRQRGTGAYAELIQHRFALAVKKLGLNRERRDLRRDLFRPPAPSPKGDARQMSLL
ncbi:MAG: PA0069 family radical SAM protein [Gemmatimonas sp.]